MAFTFLYLFLQISHAHDSCEAVINVHHQPIPSLASQSVEVSGGVLDGNVLPVSIAVNDGVFHCACGGEFSIMRRHMHGRSKQHKFFVDSPYFTRMSLSEQQSLLAQNHVSTSTVRSSTPSSATSKCECGGSSSHKDHWLSIRHQVLYLPKS